jgi:hypothetical protein
MLNICHGGEWHTVCVDDFLPCVSYGGSASGPVSSRSHSDALWVAMIEKSFAKLLGGYHGLSEVSTASALRDLSGCPCVTVSVPLTRDRHMLESADRAFWNRLAAYCSKNYIIIATSTPPRSRACPESLSNTSKYRDDRGLVINYTYTILDVKSSSLGDYLIQLRCPLNIENFSWTGEWSDTSDKWTEEMQYELEVNVEEDDRTIWMSYADFCEHFATLDVAMVKHAVRGRVEVPQWKTRRQRLWLTNMNDVSARLRPNVMCVLKVADVASEVFFSLHQSAISVGALHGNKRLSAIGLVVLRVTPDYCFELVCRSKCSISSCVEISELLPVGVYLVVPVTSSDEEEGEAVPDNDEAQAPPALIIDKSTGRFTERAEEVLSEMFGRLDGDMDGVGDQNYPRAHLVLVCKLLILLVLCCRC